ncbi:MAG: diacylglycerol kinase family lipid kinase [Cyclobacteriaceae bacterium]
MSNKKKILFVVNPISGVKKKISVETLLDQHLDSNKFDHKIHYTTCRGDAIEQSKKAVAGGIDAVVAVGGDGTINEVAQGLIHTNVPLGIIPRGSGNGFANYFRIPHDPVGAIEVINKSNTQTIDTGLMNDKLFLSVAGLGFDARVATAFDSFSQRGLLSYMYISALEYFKFKAKKYSIDINGSTIKSDAFLLTAANSSQFGNNAYISPEAKIDDGLLDLVILKPANPISALGVSLRLFKGTLHKSKYCEIHRTKELTISHIDTEAQIDGEPILVSEKTSISIQPSSLLVYS